MHKGWMRFRLCTKDECGFLLSIIMQQFSMEFCSQEGAVCLLFEIKKRPLVGGFLYTSTTVISIGATAGVLYREVVWWVEGSTVHADIIVKPSE